MKSNKYVEVLRSAPLSYPELCIQLFEGSTSNGFESWGPSSTLPHPSEEVFDHNLNGALDGTLVHAVVPVDQQTRYRGRGKG
ncbi:hypothetical protein L1987_76699 [Smallanthus sonchifolius]|uniref:Uncharacterized protein n=1 Tax=Smallanthus sonchifolius TaxID=185202 RepID=A0ACB8Z861_9ASTR|nr:hypothetical protein L1987_76699 [Smallanthus sonchifolius]